MTLPIRARLSLWYGGLLAVALIAFASAVYLIMANALQSNLDASLKSRVAQLQRGITVENGRLAFPGSEEQTDEPLVPDALLRASGRVLVGNLPPGLRLELKAGDLPRQPGIAFASSENLRYAIAPIKRSGRLAGYVVVWQSLQPVEDARRSLLWVLLAAGPLFLLAASAGGFVLARRSLQPVAHVTHTAAVISATDLQVRVPVSSARDELSALASTFNEMLDRLQSGVQRERRFAADASHELRSPLAVIRAEATLALDKPRPGEEYRRVLQVIDEQAAAMEELVGGLLLLARAETLRSRENQPVRVDRVAAEAIALCRPAMAAHEVAVESRVDDELVVKGSRALLTRAVRNLIDNAVKVSSPGETVRVRGRGEGGQLILDVEDNGPGIAEDDQRHLFEPFFQLSAARTPGDSHGLGLAICRRIVTAHGGDVSVQSAPGHGARFRIVLPLTPWASWHDSEPRDDDAAGFHQIGARNVEP
jgi:signal transduction histidine kinase